MLLNHSSPATRTSRISSFSTTTTSSSQRVEGENRDYSPHLCLVSGPHRNWINGDWSATVAPGGSYSAEPGRLVAPSSNLHISLPQVEGSVQCPTPEAFGPPLEIEGYLSQQSGWLLVLHLKRRLHRLSPGKPCLGRPCRTSAYGDAHQSTYRSICGRASLQPSLSMTGSQHHSSPCRGAAHRSRQLSQEDRLHAPREGDLESLYRCAVICTSSCGADASSPS